MPNRELLVPPGRPRSPWQRLYGGAHRLRRNWWRQRARRLPRLVISIGNLHWGGTGKTPLVAAVAAHLRDRGRRLTILSRGYGSRGSGVRFVSRGEGPLLGPSEGGDEPVLLAAELPGVAVVIGPDRHAAGLAALRQLDPPPELFLLDDGFSHLALARDLDLLVFPMSDLFGGGRLPPGGRLREPLAAVERADAALVTGEVVPGTGAELAEVLRSFGFRGPGFDAPVRPQAPFLLHGDAVMKREPALLVSGIARPDRFRQAATSFGVEIAGELRFPDHHRYPAASLEKITAACRRHGAAVVLTTAKDQVKLAGRLTVPMAVLPIRAEPEPAFFHWLDDRLAALLGEPAPEARL